MELYKKKPIKFSHDVVSRSSRHAETLRARETSRFKRLSLLRSIKDESMESVEITEDKHKKKPPSRVEALYKWKQERKIKKDLEKNLKPPFYVGGQSTKWNSNSDLPSTTQHTLHFKTSKAAGSRLLTSGTSFQSSKIPSSFKSNGIKCTNGTKINSVPSKNLTKTVGKTVISSANQNGIKCTNGSKINSVSSKNLTKTVGKTVISSANQGTFPRSTKNVKEPPSKHNIKEPVVKSIADARNGVNGKSVKASSLPKSNFGYQPNKPVPKTGMSTLSSTLSKGTSTQRTKNQKPAISVNKKLDAVSVSKLHEKVAPCLMEKVTNRRGFCLKPESDKQAGGKQKASNLREKVKEKNKIDIDTKSFQEEPLSEMNLQNVPDILFDCDVSIIKRAPSFAPDDFKFVPPAGLPDLFLDNEVFERIKEKFMTRTSTPTKLGEKSSSPVAAAACDDSPVMDKVNSLPKILVAESPKVSERQVPDQPVYEKIQYEKEIDEKLKKECHINFHGDDFSSEIDLNKVKEIFAKLKKQDEELNNDKDDLPNEKMMEPVKTTAEAHIDFPLDIGLNKHDEELNKGKDDLSSKKESTQISVDECTDSPFDIIDLNKIDELINDDVFKEKNQVKCLEKKHLRDPPKRSSVLKSVPVLNSIAETDESEIPTKYSENKEGSTITPRKSQRPSKLTILEENAAFTPRRSTRLQAKKFHFEDSEPVDKSRSQINPRRSMRLIDLNTPDKEKNNYFMDHTNFTTDFEKLTLEEAENINPHACLIDFDYSPGQNPKSKKISLLYSPEKVRKSMRKSIRGDLMSFSPTN